MNTVMHILINGDSGFRRPLATALYSLRKNLPPSIKINAFFAYFEGDLLKEGVDLFRLQLGKSDTLTLLPVPFCEIDTHGALWNTQVFLKVLALFVLPDEIDRILYFDGDVVFDGSMLPFYSREMPNGVAMLGTNECDGKGHRDRCLVTDGIYLNGGVLLLRPSEFKNKWEGGKAFIYDFEHAPFFTKCLEQDFINYIFDGKKECWPDNTYMRFALDAWIVNPPPGYLSQQPVAWHFAGKAKPWKYNTPHTYDRIFWKYGRHVYPFGFRVAYSIRKFFFRLSGRVNRFLRRLSS